MIYKNSTFDFKKTAAKLFTVFIFLFLQTAAALAVSRTWDGGGATNNWSDAANWSGDAVPTSADDAVFNSTNVKNSAIDTAFTVNSVAVNSGYSGTITQNAALTTTGSFVQNAGTFTGGADNLDVGAFSLTAGNFTATVGILNVNNSYFSVTGGTFNANGGTVSINGISQSFNAPVTFNNLTFTNTATSYANPTINGVLTLQNGQLFGGSAFFANGNVVYGAGFTGGDVILNFQDSATRTVQLNASNGLLGMRINNPNITVRTADSGASTINYTTNLLQGRLEQGSGDLTIIANVTGVSLNQSGGTFAGSAGRLNLNGTTNLTGGNFTGGTGLIGYSSGTPGFSQYGGVFSTSGNVNIYSFYQQGGIFNAPAGTLSLVSQIFLNTGAVFNNNNGTIALNGTGVIVVAASQAFYNITVNSGYNSFNSIINGTLSLVDGTLNGGTAIVNGNVTYASTFDGGSELLQFSDSATRTINLPASNFLLGMIIDNPNITITTSGAGASTIVSASQLKRGTFAQGSAALTFNDSGLAQSGGTFTGSAQSVNLGGFPSISGGVFQGGTGLVSLGGSFAQTGGTFSAAGDVDAARINLSGGVFNAPSGLLTIVAGFSHPSSGTFNAGTGTVKITGFSSLGCSNGIPIDVPTTDTFYNLQIANSINCNQIFIFNGDTLVVNGDFRLSYGGIGGGRVRANGTVTVDSTFTGNPLSTSTVVEFVQPNRNFVINTPSTAVKMLSVEMNAANSTLTTSGSGQINFNSMNLLDGTLNQPNAIWDFTTYPGYTQSGGTFNGSAAQLNISNGATTGNVLTGGTFNGGTGLINGGYAQSGGTFSTQGDMNVGGFILSGGIFNAPSGTLDIFNGFTHTGGGTFNAGTGTVQTSALPGVFGIQFDVNSNETFNNLKFNGTNNNANHLIASGDTLNVNGTLTFNGRGVSGGSIVANGNVVYSNYGGYQNATTLVKFQDSAARTITFCTDGANCGGAYIQPTLVNNPNITINSGVDNATLPVYWQSLDLRQGTVNSGNSLNNFNGDFSQSGGTFNGNQTSDTFNQNFALSGGAYNAAPQTNFGLNYTHTAGGAFNYGTGTVNFFGTGSNYSATIDVNAAENFYNVVFNVSNSLYTRTVAAGDTITANGNLSITGGGAVGGGTLEAKRDFTIANGFAGGNASVLFSGAVNQSFTNNSTNSLSGTWTVNKPNSSPFAENSYAPAVVTNLLVTGIIGGGTGGYVPLAIVSGNVVETGAYNMSLSSLAISTGASLVNEFGGTLTLAGNLTNDGSINFNGAGSGCPQADTMIVRSSVAGTQRQWSGAGDYRLIDLDLKDQNSVARSLIVYSGTDSGNNSNFVFNSGCLAPTAATATLGGRIVNTSGRGIARVRLTMTDADGNIHYAASNPFGYYRFADVAVGQTVVIQIVRRKHTFGSETRIVNVTGDADDINFTASPNPDSGR